MSRRLMVWAFQFALMMLCFGTVQYFNFSAVNAVFLTWIGASIASAVWWMSR